MTEDSVGQILTKYRTVAVVGLSRDPSKPSYEVAEYLQNHGFRIVPVNPFVDEVLGERSYRSLLEIPNEIQKSLEIIEIFRPTSEVVLIVQQAIKLREQNSTPNVVWLQKGIVNREAADIGRRAGLAVVMDKCMMQEHKKLVKQAKSK